MILINQDETLYLNFNKINYIKIVKLPSNEIGYAISVDTDEDTHCRFAIYDTEERAKEVMYEMLHCEKFYIMPKDKDFNISNIIYDEITGEYIEGEENGRSNDKI